MSTTNGTKAANGPPTAKPKRHQPARLGRLLFHTATVAYMAHAYLSLGTLFAQVKAGTEPEYGGDLRFLTIWGFWLSQIALVFSAMADIIPESGVLYSAKRLFALAALPIEVTVSSIYWPLIIFLPALILPPRPEMEALTSAHPDPSMIPADTLFFIPLWIDIGLHLLPTVALLFDFFLLEKKYRPPTSTRTAALIATAVGAGYAVWSEHAATFNEGKYPYPFLDIMSFEARCATYAAGTVWALFVFQAVNFLHK